jgi:hypothetical protein
MFPEVEQRWINRCIALRRNRLPARHPQHGQGCMEGEARASATAAECPRLLRGMRSGGIGRCLVGRLRSAVRVCLRQNSRAGRRRGLNAWQGWQGSAFVRVRSDVRSPADSAQPSVLSERQRTDANAAPNRQAGGHWFEPSTAHRKSLQRACVVAVDGDTLSRLWQG